MLRWQWLLFAAMAWASKLQWQDCGLLADERGLEILEYSHAPDPIVLGEPYSITRRFRLLLDRPIQNLTEKFWGYKQTGPAWSPTFAPPVFSRCGAEQFQTKCPLEPHGVFAFHERHPGTHVVAPGMHKAVEHYFADGIFVGCGVVEYNYVAPNTTIML